MIALRLAPGLALVLTSSFAMASPTKPDDPRVERALKMIETGDVSARIEGYRKLTELKVPRVGAKLVDRLPGLAPANPEAAALLAYWAAVPVAKASAAAGGWLVAVVADASGQVLPSPVPAALLGAEAVRSLELAARVVGKAPLGPDVQGALAALATHPDKNVAGAALAALAASDRLESKAVLAPLLHVLGSRPEHDVKTLTALVATRDSAAVYSIIDAALSEVESNPMMGAPEHIHALEQLTKKKLGRDPAAWRAKYPKPRTP